MIIKTLVEGVFGTRQAREVKRLTPMVRLIHEQEERLKHVSESELRGQTAKFRERIAQDTGGLKTELDTVRKAKHECADPGERSKLEQRAVETREGIQEGRSRLRWMVFSPRLSPRSGRPAAGWSEPECRSPGTS